MSADKEQEKKEETKQEIVKDDVVEQVATDGEVSEEKNPPAGGEESSDEKKTESSEGSDVSGAPKKKKRKVRRQVQRGKAYILSTYNNTMITLTDLHGNGLAWSSAGLLGFKGAKKATTYAANQVVLDVAEKVAKYGLSDLEIYVKGVGSGREAAIRGLAQKGFNLSLIKDTTPIPHNGCRPPKPRRV